MNKCKNCLNFSRFTEDKTYLGECHANAPIILPSVGHKTGVWPIVSEDSGCTNDFIDLR